MHTVIDQLVPVRHPKPARIHGPYLYRTGVGLDQRDAALAAPPKLYQLIAVIGPCPGGGHDQEHERLQAQTPFRRLGHNWFKFQRIRCRHLEAFIAGQGHQEFSVLVDRI